MLFEVRCLWFAVYRSLYGGRCVSLVDRCVLWLCVIVSYRVFLCFAFCCGCSWCVWLTVIRCLMFVVCCLLSGGRLLNSGCYRCVVSFVVACCVFFLRLFVMCRLLFV